MKSRSTAGTSLTKVREAILLRRFLGASVVGMAVFMLAFILVPYVIAEASATTTSTDVTWASIYLTLDPDYVKTQAGEAIDAFGHGDVEFGEVTPTTVDTSTGAYGTQKVAKRTIRVTTNGKYYAVFLSMADDNNDLEITAGDSDQVIPAIGGTFAEPVNFARSGWGYAVPNTPISGAGFSEKASYVAYDGNLAGSANDNLTKTGTGSAFYNGGTWAAVPVVGSAQQIWRANNASGFTAGSDFDVYYSLMVDNDIMAGTYENNIVYTALASTADIDVASTNLSRSERFVTSGTTETIKVDLASTDLSLTANDVKVYVVPHRVFVNNSYTVDGLSAADYAQCAVSNITNDGTAAQITCAMPNIGTPATSGAIAVAGNNSALAADSASVTGEYDLWVRINAVGTDVDYISKYSMDATNIPAVVYAGLQSKQNATNGGKEYISQMQDMNSMVCKNTNMWGNTIGIDARVYDHTGTGTPLASTSADSATIGTGTFALTDIRDNKTYLVRRLADGGCWMVQNLDLNLADFTSDKTARLTSDNTNLNTKNQWIPDAKMRAKSSVLETTGNIANLSVSDYQFQSDTNFGNEFKWGSVCAEGTGPLSSNPSVACNPISVANNANSSYARSYNNDDGVHPAYLPGTSNILGPVSTCAAYTSTQTSGHNECHMASVTSDASLNAGTQTGDNKLPRDTSWQPKLVSNAGGVDTSGSDTFTMRGSMYVGDYYNWYAATAETGEYTTQTTVQDDICPKGWRLPVNDASSDGSWKKLLSTAYGMTSAGYGNGASIAKVMQLPLSIPMSGYYSWASGTLYARGYSGDYWSSTAYSQTNANYLYFNYGGFFYPQYGYDKVYGFTVRCVVK